MSMEAAKKIFIFIIVLLFAAPILGWLINPDMVPLLRRIWRLTGAPDFVQRLLYLGIFAGIVIFLSIRMMKGGPL